MGQSLNVRPARNSIFIGPPSMKILARDEPPGYQPVRPRVKPKLGPFLKIITAILEADRSAPPKQRHTAVRISHRLRSEFGFQALTQHSRHQPQSSGPIS